MRLVNNKTGKDFKSMIRLSLIAFLCELPNFVLTIISAIVSYTPVVWVDTVNSLGETLHCFIVFIVTLGLQKQNEDKYNYGTERIESFSSFCCDALVMIGMIAVAIGAVMGIVNPTQPTDNLLLFLILKCSNSLWDLVFLISAIKASKKASSRLGDSEVRNYAKALTFDLLVGIIVGFTYFFRTESWICYANPVVSIILVVVFIIIYVKKIKESVEEITDKSISLENQDMIFDIVLNNNRIIERIEEINCRKLNKKTYIEICVKMHGDTTYIEQIEYLNSIRGEIEKIIPDSVVKLVIGQTDYQNQSK